MYTQCPHCQAYFEVTAEQLKIGGGDVRCGQCLSVFNAVQNLTETLPDWEEEDANLYADWAKDNPPSAELPPHDDSEGSTAGEPFISDYEPEPALGDIDAVADELGTRIDTGGGDAVARTPAETPSGETPAASPHQDDEAFTRRQIEAIEPSGEGLEEQRPGAEGASVAAERAADAGPPPQAPTIESDEGAGRPAEAAAPQASAREIYAQPVLDTPPRRDTADEDPSANLPAPLLRQLQEEKAASLRPPATPWVIGSLLMLLLLVAQAGYFYRDQLAQQRPELRPWLERACEYLGCTLRRPPSQARIDILGWDVRTLPDTPQALLASTTLVNRTPEAQPYPLLTLRFSDMNGKPVAQRRFLPREYLPAGTDIKAGMPPQTPVPVELALVDPGRQAVNFEFHTQGLPPQ